MLGYMYSKYDLNYTKKVNEKIEKLNKLEKEIEEENIYKEEIKRINKISNRILDILLISVLSILFFKIVEVSL